MEKLTANILIIGAGPAGTSTALFLAKHGISSLLVDKAQFPRDKVCGDALSGKVVEIFNKLDPAIMNEFSREPGQIGSWGVTFVAPNRKVLRVPFKQNINKNERAPGFISKRQDFDYFLFKKAKNSNYIETLEGVNLTEFQKKEKGWLAFSACGNFKIETKLLIACDGTHSVFARQHGGIEMEPNHYCAGLRAYYSGVKNLDRDNFIELHFLKDFLPGYFWIFPLPNGMANVGVGMRSDKVSARKINLKESLQTLIETDGELKERFSEARLHGKISGFGLPLGSKKRKISGEGFMLCGDAASLIDPFTGEGIGNALVSGMFAAERAMQCLEQNDFSATFLSSYDKLVYDRLWSELNLSRRMQQLVNYPRLFNLVVNKANSNKMLRETISCMFEDLDLRARLKQPSFYLRLLLG